ncbi:MAG: hypothetical protein IMX00_07825 [Limnochordales bacterium]|nr:hypothetical protein [Limnochordales bacterium]
MPNPHGGTNVDPAAAASLPSFFPSFSLFCQNPLASPMRSQGEEKGVLPVKCGVVDREDNRELLSGKECREMSVSCGRPFISKLLTLATVLAVAGMGQVVSFGLAEEAVTAAPRLAPLASYGVASLGASARGAALTADGKTLYVAGIQDKAIWKVETETGNLLARADLAAINPEAWGKAVAVDGEGRVWATGTVPELYVFDANLELEARFDLARFGLVNPEGVAVDPKGRIYVTDRRGSVGVYRFVKDEAGEIALDSSWGEGGFVALGADLRQPAFNPGVGLVVGDFAGDTLYYLWAVDGSVYELARLASAFHVAADEQGRSYVVHYGSEPALTILDDKGEVIATFSKAELGIETEAAGVAVSPDGRILVVLDQRPADGLNVKVFRVEW